jgi:hypothetical protein
LQTLSISVAACIRDVSVYSQVPVRIRLTVPPFTAAIVYWHHAQIAPGSAPVRSGTDPGAYTGVRRASLSADALGLDRQEALMRVLPHDERIGGAAFTGAYDRDFRGDVICRGW